MSESLLDELIDASAARELARKRKQKRREWALIALVMVMVALILAVIASCIMLIAWSFQQIAFGPLVIDLLAALDTPTASVNWVTLFPN